MGSAKMGLKHSKLSECDIQKLSQETCFTTDEIKKWYAGFAKDCPTGEMQKTEFIKVYSAMFPNGDARQFSAYIFSVIDADDSGSVSFPEFMKALSLTSDSSTDQKLDWAFTLYDIDNSGSITKDELTKVFQSIYSLVSNSDYF